MHQGAWVLWTQVAAVGDGQKAADALGAVTASLAILAGTMALLAVKVGFIGLSLWLGLRFPAYTRRIDDRYRNRRWAVTVLGITNIALGLLLALILMKTQVLAFLGLLLLLGLGLVGVLAYGAAYRDAGLGLTGSMPAHGAYPLRQHIWGGILLETAFLVPVLGQFLSLGILLRGFGAVVLALASGSCTSTAGASVTTRPPEA